MEFLTMLLFYAPTAIYYIPSNADKLQKPHYDTMCTPNRKGTVSKPPPLVYNLQIKAKGISISVTLTLNKVLI